MKNHAIIQEIKSHAEAIEDILEGNFHGDFPNINDAMSVLWSAIEDDLKLGKTLEKSGEE